MGKVRLTKRAIVQSIATDLRDVYTQFSRKNSLGFISQAHTLQITSKHFVLKTACL